MKSQQNDAIQRRPFVRLVAFSLRPLGVVRSDTGRQTLGVSAPVEHDRVEPRFTLTSKASTNKTHASMYNLGDNF